MARRIRTHANPLAYPEPITREQWSEKLGTDKPLFVDMGCGKGDFAIESAKNNPNRNYVAIEVRTSMCEEVNKKIEEDKVSNVICVSGNASISLKQMFKEGEIKELYVNFPDPWLKEKHHKRRIIKDSVVEDLFDILADDGKIFLLTDVEEVYDDFYSRFIEKFEAIPYEEKQEKTYWQKWHENKGTQLHSSCFVKK